MCNKLAKIEAELKRAYPGEDVFVGVDEETGKVKMIVGNDVVVPTVVAVAVVGWVSKAPIRSCHCRGC